MLNLPEFNIIQQEQNEHYYRFTVERSEPPYMCTSCGWIDRSDEDVPKQIDVKTNNVVWFEEDEGFHERQKEFLEELNKKKEILDKIKKYKPRWYHKAAANYKFLSLDIEYLEKKLEYYDIGFYQDILSFYTEKKLKRSV